MAITRRTFLKTLFGAFGGVTLVGGGTAFYAARIEAFAVQIVERTFYLENLPAAFEGYRIAHLTDIHLGRYMPTEQMTYIAALTNGLAADLIAITGDFVSGTNTSVNRRLAQVMPPFSAPDGVYAVLGNHDYWMDGPAVQATLESAGLVVMKNEHIRLQRGDDILYFGGVDDVYVDQQDFTATMRGIPADGCAVLMVHEPDYADVVATDARVKLQLSGHSHGGQVRFPVVGALKLPRWGRKYPLGDYQIGGLQLHVNPGVGMTSLPFRFGCPPEITHITLRRA